MFCRATLSGSHTRHLWGCFNPTLRRDGKIWIFFEFQFCFFFSLFSNFGKIVSAADTSGGEPEFATLDHAQGRACSSVANSGCINKSVNASCPTRCSAGCPARAWSYGGRGCGFRGRGPTVVGGVDFAAVVLRWSGVPFPIWKWTIFDAAKRVSEAISYLKMDRFRRRNVQNHNSVVTFFSTCLQHSFVL